MAWHPGEGFSHNGRNPDSNNGTGKRAQTLPDYPEVRPATGAMPPARPLPLLAAIKQLPHQYRFVTSKPWVETFLAVVGQAGWGIVWVQLAGYAFIAALLSFLKIILLSTPAQTNLPANASGVNNPQVVQAITLSTSVGLLVLIPLMFFAAMGILYLLARAFGGRGAFVQQAYTTLLFLVPFGLIVSVLGVIPLVGSFLSTFLAVLGFVYGVVLECFATVAVHRMTGGKATTAVVLSALIAIPVGLTLLFGLSVLFYAV